METIDFNEVIRDNIEVVGELMSEATSLKKGLASPGMYRVMFVSGKAIKIIPNKTSYTFLNYRAIVYNNGHCYIYDIIFSTQGDQGKGNNFHCYTAWGTRTPQALKMDSSGNLYIYAGTFNNINIALYCLTQINSTINNIKTEEVSESEYNSLSLLDVPQVILKE